MSIFIWLSYEVNQGGDGTLQFPTHETTMLKIKYIAKMVIRKNENWEKLLVVQ